MNLACWPRDHAFVVQLRADARSLSEGGVEHVESGKGGVKACNCSTARAGR